MGAQNNNPPQHQASGRNDWKINALQKERKRIKNKAPPIGASSQKSRSESTIQAGLQCPHTGFRVAHGQTSAAFSPHHDFLIPSFSFDISRLGSYPPADRRKKNALDGKFFGFFALNTTEIIGTDVSQSRYGAAGTKTWLDSVAAEGRQPDYVYQVNIKNDKAFDAAAATARNAPTWYAFPNGETSTNCSVAANHALKSGGVPVSPTSAAWPNWLNSNLLIDSLTGDQVYRLPRAPW